MKIKRMENKRKKKGTRMEIIRMKSTAQRNTSIKTRFGKSKHFV